MAAEQSVGRCFIGAIDQGTTSSRFLVFDERCSQRANCQKKIKQFTSADRFEADPEELVRSVEECIEEVLQENEEVREIGVKCVGIANQRETIVLWDKVTGDPLYKAVVWCDNRTEQLANELVQQTPNNSKDYYRLETGLPIHPYFSALKLRWLIDNVPAVRQAIENGTCMFGTVDTWLIWRLTGGTAGGVHVTDVTNASRTLLMNIRTLQWDPELFRFFKIPMDKINLPQIMSSSEYYGSIASGPLKGVPICGCLGDQQAALVGQRCFSKGDVKNTYGTGCFMLYNTGTGRVDGSNDVQPVRSLHGLLTTVAYKLGRDQPTHYALEGPMATAGQGVNWLKEDLEFFKHEKEIEALARQVPDTADVYFVPAFSGLYAPYWEADARGLIVGLTNASNKAHICRATLEAVCFMSKETLEVMNLDSEMSPLSLRVDGGMTNNKLMLQLQADLLGIPVECPSMVETTALGAAIAAGLATGVWSDLSTLPDPTLTSYQPSIGHDERDARFARWKEAVQRSRHWHKTGTTQKSSVTREQKVRWGFSVGVLVGAVAATLVTIVVTNRR